MIVKELNWMFPQQVFRELYLQGFPVRLFLDSASVNKKTGRYSIICVGEVERFCVKNSKNDPFKKLEEFFLFCQGSYRIDLEIPFGIYGFISYDANRYIELINSSQKDDINFPDVCFFLPETTLIFDNVDRKAWLVDLSEKFLSVHLKSGKKSCIPDLKVELIGFNMSKDYFIGSVEKIKDYIRSGDTFQVNFSQRIDVKFDGDLFILYDRLRRINPSPFSFFMDFEDLKAVSCSPERLVKRYGLSVETRPIAGTKRRGKDRQEDHKLERELFLSEKERAEHIMLVDLERNDLGRVCEYGTVEVDELMVRESYSHVMHIVSNVKGKLKKEISSFDLIKAVFPGGTITGAPKVRTMEIIAELEPTRRALYTGSVGYIGFNDTLDLNIVIRTFLLKGNKGYLQVGAGIVWDSEPYREYQETLQKAKALLVAAGLSL